MEPEDYILMCDQTLDILKRKHIGSESRQTIKVRIMLVRTHYAKLARKKAKEGGERNFQYADKVV